MTDAEAKRRLELISTLARDRLAQLDREAQQEERERQERRRASRSDTPAITTEDVREILPRLVAEGFLMQMADGRYKVAPEWV